MKTFTLNNGHTFLQKDNGYCYAIVNNTKTRIGRPVFNANYEQFVREENERQNAVNEFTNIDALVEEAQESADTEAAKEYDQWAAEADAEYQARKDLQEAKDRETEANYEAETSKPKKTRKPRRSKNIAYEGHGVTLTAKQVDFLRHLPDTNFWERGLDSCIWIDCLCDDIGGQFKNKPMTVGAMISTICEKGLGQRGRDESRKGKPTIFELTELGKAVAAELGVH